MIEQPESPHSEQYPELVIGSWWRHNNSGEYRIVRLSNIPNTERYPLTVEYVGRNGRPWSRRADDWHRSMTAAPDLNEVQARADADRDARAETEARQFREDSEMPEDALLDAEFDGWGVGHGEADHECPLNHITQPRQFAAWWTGFGKGKRDKALAKPGNATFIYFKKSGKFYEQARGVLPESVFNDVLEGKAVWLDNADKRAELLKANSSHMPGLSTTGSSFTVIVIGDEGVDYGWPLILPALEDE